MALSLAQERDKVPSTHCTGGWVGTGAGQDGCGKSRPPPPGFNPRTVQPVASRYPGPPQQ